jgi:hypothetical protein
MTSFDDERKALTLLKVIYEERLKNDTNSTRLKVMYQAYLLNVNERLKYLDKVVGEE